MKIRYLIGFLSLILFFACSDEETIIEDNEFYLSQTKIDFSNEKADKTIEIFNAEKNVSAKVVSENSDWCSASVNNNSIKVSVDDNILIKSRTAVVRVTFENRFIDVFVRQNQKIFTSIPAVNNLKAKSGAGKVTLSWDIPTQDNFSHVIINYNKRGEDYSQTLEPGITEFTINELFNADGEYIFNVQSVDKFNDLGETASVKEKAGKLVAFRFKSQPKPQWLSYYLRTSNTYNALLYVGSSEFNENEDVTISFEIDNEALAAYNDANGTNLQIIPTEAYTLPNDYLYDSHVDYQELNIPIDQTYLQDRQNYALPIKIKSVSSQVINDIMNSVILIYSVDDLAGWYTVDRLDKCGEGAGQYPSNINDRRRFIKRLDDYNWVTGYLFKAYSKNETQDGSGSAVQYITLDPDTKSLHIQQGSYATSDDRNVFDPSTNELTIEYLYAAWAGWWTHEKMYNRSFER
ncbi:MAG: DUF1735 domain-containing protein [Bacteroidales bacterium]|nr:DUF1735 domain-containing protein [Bacteroidales bacterium]